MMSVILSGTLRSGAQSKDLRLFLLDTSRTSVLQDQ
jgi:hypothetical protein